MTSQVEKSFVVLIPGGAPIGKVKPILDEFKRWRIILDQQFRQHITSNNGRAYTRS